MGGKEPGLIGRIKDKLVESKQKWAREGRLLTGAMADPASERLPPGQRLVQNWPVLDLGIRPALSLESWRLSVDGLVANPISWSWADFRAQPQTESVSDIHCVTAWSRYDNHWEGVAARHLLALVRPLPEAAHILFHAHDGYTTNLPLKAFDRDDVLLAAKWQGAPLASEHGGPVRVVVPKLYFWKSAKWVKRIEFVSNDSKGFWEVRGYHNEADPWKEERYG
ncbi:MAG TPA: sulfite oxidase-like oxidoreductase [Alphaproteobacteria bacterium]|nr:sulfite oxidase-like oxidoreductase [Alphaproteobacteria bacterium]